MASILSWFRSPRHALAAAAVAVVVLLAFLLRHRSEQVRYITAPVTQGSIVRAVTASGTVNPVVTVQVGSYVSGPIIAIYADYNAPVKKGQLIAKIDPKTFEVVAAEARATLANAKAQLRKDQADVEYKKVAWQRNEALLAQSAVSADVRDSSRSAARQAQAQVELDKATIQQQEALVRAAEVNLGYTDIVSPVDGTVVSRNVDVGQTVAASFQTPTLFLIAQDLTQMQVDSNVSESDIGGVRAGQPVKFTVDAFPDRDFEGAVRQVRQAPITVQNVVTYDVVVSVANPEMLLKPGMTANLTIVTARRDNVMRVPLQALRFKPGLRARLSANANDIGGAIPRNARVWLLDGGAPRAVAITTGLDDGKNVEMLKGSLRPDEQVVTDEVREARNGDDRMSPPGFARMR